MLKPLLPRRRPAASELPAYQTHRQPADLVVVPVRARGVGRRVRDRGGDGEPAARARRGAPLAAAVAYSRVHVGVHWTSDVVVGAAVGTGVALLTQRWWPVRRTRRGAGPAAGQRCPELPDGEGLVIVSNQRSGDPNYDPADELEAALPRAVVVRADTGPRASTTQLDAALAERGGGWARAIGVAGGDGSVAAAAAVAGAARAAARGGADRHPQPLRPRRRRVRPAGGGGRHRRRRRRSPWTSALVDVHPGRGADPESSAVTRVRCFLNTASLGSYPDLVRLREQWQPRWGKWPAFAAALIMVLRRAEPVRDQDRRPSGGRCGSCSSATAPTTRGAWCPPGGRRSTPGCSTCAGCAPTCGSPGCGRWPRCCWARSGTAGCTRQCEVPELDVELAVPGMLATDGEVVEHRRAATRSGWPRSRSRSTAATRSGGRGGRGRTWGSATVCA